MKKAITIGFGFTVGAWLAKVLEGAVEYTTLKLLANNDEFMTFIAVNSPATAKKIEMLRRK